MDLAASIQAVTEEVVLRLARALASETGAANLCLAGGVALNCVANGKVLRDGPFERDLGAAGGGRRGGAVGAALCAYHLFQGQPRSAPATGDAMAGGYLGPAFARPRSRGGSRGAGARFTSARRGRAGRRGPPSALADGKAVGWFQGRMEFGPRALGARSILGDRAVADDADALNLKVKFRESFRPFAPVGAAGGRGRLVRARRRQPLHAARRRRWPRTGVAR